MCEKRKASLLDVLAESADCLCLSDLRNVPHRKRHQLADMLETIQVDDYSLLVWNDTLTYLTDEPSQASSEVACKMLIDYFRN